MRVNEILFGDCRASLRMLADEGVSVQTCVTSPPYFGLRDYGVDGQIGLEQTPEEYIARLVEVFRGVRDVLADDGTLWLNIGDSYASGGRKTRDTDAKLEQRGMDTRPADPAGLKPKDLIGIPWMLAFALRSDGWYLRQDIIWHKPNPMPESVRDRCTKAHEYLFLLSKSERYFFDSEAIKEPASQSSIERAKYGYKHAFKNQFAGSPSDARHQDGKQYDAGAFASEKRNRRSVWTVATRPYKGAHFAVFPPDLIVPTILAGTSERGHCPECGARWVREVERVQIEGESASVSDNRKPLHTDTYSRHKLKVPGGQSLVSGFNKTTGWRPACDCGHDPVPDVVLDPFMGSGTTAEVAILTGRQYIGCELNPEYKPLQEDRIASAHAELKAATDQIDLFETEEVA